MDYKWLERFILTLENELEDIQINLINSCKAYISDKPLITQLQREVISTVDIAFNCLLAHYNAFIVSICENCSQVMGSFMALFEK